MDETRSPYSVFHLTGERSGTGLEAAGRLGLRPALFSAYPDLSRLRYDYPLVLVDGGDDGAAVRSLSDIVADVLREIAPRGTEGDRLRKQVLGLETEIRTLASRGSKGTLLQLWDLAETNLLGKADDAGRDALADSLDLARAGLRLDGAVLDCDRETPVGLLTHAWSAVQADKAHRFRDTVDPLVLKLSNILKADSMRSRDAFDAGALKQSIGTSYQAAMDFEALSDILGQALPDGAMPETRRLRIRSALSVLSTQDFHAPTGEGAKKGRRKDPGVLVFDRCTRALAAFRKRLPEMVEVIKAMTIARLEIDNRYKESTHDSFFRGFDERVPEPRDLALFPSYLVCLRNGVDPREETASLIEVLASDLPIKIVVQNDDILDSLSKAKGEPADGIKGARLATMALGLANPFVLQSSSASLYQMRDSLLRGLAADGPALFSVFSGSGGTASGSSRNAPEVPPYLHAAAATESRAFPAFVYDPAAGADWATRFSVGVNPQAEADWPIHRLAYEDEDLQSLSEDVAFTLVDFAAADPRYAESFARVPRDKWHDDMVPVDAFLELNAEEAADKVPYTLMVDENNGLHRAIVEDKLIQAARRYRETWRHLQELGGINNSHARRLLATEREAWEQEKEQELAALRSQPAPEAETPAAVPETETPPAAPDEAATEPVAAALPETVKPPIEEPYIETPRCTTCDECTEINNRMFVYDDNKQAYIADPDAGTYRQLVEAAESCQVAIIHPGRPRNPSEPDLDALIARAEPFD